METVRAGGRKYSDPDVLALIRAGGGLADPRSLVLNQATRLVEKYRVFEHSRVTPRERLVHLASMVGLTIVPMSLERRKDESRDAVLIPKVSGGGGKGQVFFNPDRPDGRVNFTIAHEIVHTFFPVTAGGARFREMNEPDSREARELENLCDLAAAELLMPADDFRREIRGNWSLSQVARLSERFGGSFEATAFRLATAHPDIAAAGLLRFRYKVGEQRAIEAEALQGKQGTLFGGSKAKKSGTAERKYRRQSFHISDSFPDDWIVRWNKSFEKSSVVYSAGQTEDLLRGQEGLPSASHVGGTLEVQRAPYQRENANTEHPDLIFFWVFSPHLRQN